MPPSSTPPLPLSPFDRPIRRHEIVDTGWDDLGEDPIEDYAGRAGRLRDEDDAW